MRLIATLKEKATGRARNVGRAHVPFLLTARFQPSQENKTRKQKLTKGVPTNPELPARESSRSSKLLSRPCRRICHGLFKVLLIESHTHYPPKTNLRK